MAPPFKMELQRFERGPFFMVKIHIDDQCQGGMIAPELHSHFIEMLGSCIYDGIWVGEDSDIPNIRGIRKDFVEALKAIAPPVIRWPGGCYADTYHWRNGIGKRSERPVTFNENFGTFELDTNQFGIHEFMDLCRMVGAKPWLNVNLISGSVAEMKEWMEYCNREEDTTIKQEREANGSKEAFRVEYWGIGNEPWAGGGNFTAQGYADAYRKYATAAPSFRKSMMDKDAVPMRLILCGPDGNKPAERTAWTKELFEAFGKYRRPPMYGYDLHFYNWNISHQGDTDLTFDKDGWYRVIDRCFELEDVILEQYALIQDGLAQLSSSGDMDRFNKKQCELFVGEWGNWHGSAFMARPALFQQVTMRDAITSALTLDIFHRNCGKVKMACVAQTVNVLNALFLTDGKRFIRTPNYDVFQMYMVHRGAVLINSRCSFEKNETARVHVLASLKDNAVSVNIINTSYDHSEDVEIALPGNYTYLSGKVLCSGAPEDYNSWEQPDLIRARECDPLVKTPGGWLACIPAASVSVYQFKQ